MITTQAANPIYDDAIYLNGTPLFDSLVKACQSNPWLKRGGCEFEPEGFCCESDYNYHLNRYESIETLEAFFDHGNWGIRSGVTHRDLVFVNQVNGGDEWWTLKILPNGELLPFESITFRPMIERGEFTAFIDRMANATPEQCKSLTYNNA
jgi:hypothetical protein